MKATRRGSVVRTWKGKLGLLVVGCIIGLLLAEGGFRLLGIGAIESSAFQRDPYCGSRHVPLHRGWQTREGRIWFEINTHGFRDRERTLDKPPQTYRIAVVGDSFSEALQVELDDAWWSVMQDKLNERLPSAMQVEVLNFGVGGFGTAQELEMLRHYVWDFQPDMIMLELLASNDVRENSRALSQETDCPYYELVSGNLVLDESFLRNSEHARFETSRWIRLKHFVVENSRVAATIYKLRHLNNQTAKADGGELGLSMTAFQEPDDPVWDEAWAVTDRLVVEIGREANSHGASFVVLLANCGAEVNPDDAPRARLLEQLRVPDLLYPQRRIVALGESHGFTVVRTAEATRKYCEANQAYVHGFTNTRRGTGHWNERGHRLAGELAADHIIAHGLGPFASSGEFDSNRSDNPDSQADRSKSP